MKIEQEWTASSVADELMEIAKRVSWLVPSGRDPGKFHEDKSELSYEICDIARKIDRNKNQGRT